MPLSGSFSLRPPPRHPALDAARGFAVLAMVIGHTLHALLSPSARENEWVQHYWSLRGLTAPLFLLVSGWAVVAAMDRRTEGSRGIYGRLVRRALLLIFLGYLLRWPGWEAVQALGWSEALMAQLFAFDALQCIGASLLVGATVLSLARGSRIRTLVLGVLAVGIVLASPAVWQFGPNLPIALRQATGMDGSQFTLFPWASYFFVGSLLAWLLRMLRPGWPQGVVLAALGAGMLGATLKLPADWAPTSAWLVAFRVGQGLIVLAVANFAPVRLTRLLAPLGLLSLWVYLLHLPVVYGWAGTPGLSDRVGPTLELVPALLAGLGLLAACYAVARLLRRLRRLTFPWRPAATTVGTSFGRSQRV
ncbi:acyltransferase family protein [Hyalangium minutum]|uniref:Acyltransferase family protein n=1 Tax=Hyalangium minutum TaxID=394096 RepID=A0A085W8P4_9BACT|nr:acyltransferase [Hyalangium minutum]KFE64057.1 Acyltransferase family protein [Hyalangium minutum]